MSTPMSNATDAEQKKLFVLGFDSPLSAQEALLATARLGRAGCLILHDAVFVTRSKDGSGHHVQETRDTAAQTAHEDGFLSLLFGATWGGPAGADDGSGVGASFLSPFAAQLTSPHATNPHATSLAILVSNIDRLAVLDELTRYARAELIELDVPLAVEAAVRAFHEAAAQAPPASAAGAA
jgi:uncharacterized membrane protein